MSNHARVRFLHKIQETWPNSVVVSVATVLWEGWEMDNHVALVSLPSDRVFLVTTDHGQLVECPVAELEDARKRHARASRSIEDLQSVIAGRHLSKVSSVRERNKAG